MSDTMNNNDKKQISALATSSSGGDNEHKDKNVGTLHQLRSSYADAFLSRCNKVDPNDFDLPFGVYVCPWMPSDPHEEVYYECGITGFGKTFPDVQQCQNCAKMFDEGTPQSRIHVNECSIEILGNQNFTDVGQKMVAYEEYKKNPWKILPKESNENVKKDLEYWSSRCQTKNLPLFGAETMRRPDMWCPTTFKLQHGNKKLDFGSHCFQASLLPSKTNAFPGFSPCAIQATWAPLDDTLNFNDYGRYHENTKYRMGINYTKDAVWAYNQRHTWRDDKDVWRPFTPHFSVPLEGVNPNIVKTHSGSWLFQQHGGSNADVWTTENHTIGPCIKPLLQDLANATNDRPLPRYQMIIDPNQFVRPRKSDGKKVWVPCEFDVASDGSGASLVGKERAHWMDTGLIDSVATPVLTAALPLLAKLTKPFLLLEGQRLQVVVKAQSITVPKKQEDDDAPEYVGLWHVDGEHEPVVAVVLYYYDVDDALVGGNMELLDRRPLAVLGQGDTDMPSDLPPGALREAFRPRTSSTDGDGDEEIPEPLIPNCSVPIKTGTLLVFSNYQMAHRVLRMVNTSQERAASRKFVALFVMDPAAERLVPAKSHLAHTYLYKRALTGKCEVVAMDSSKDSLPAIVATLIMEYLGVVPSQQERRATRNEMLRSQLMPKHSLGKSDSMVCSTGNGCLTMLGWIDSLLMEHSRYLQVHGDTNERFEKPEKRVNALNYPPKEVGRGLSETLSIPSDDLNLASFYDTLDGRNEQLNADFDKMD